MFVLEQLKPKNQYFLVIKSFIDNNKSYIKQESQPMSQEYNKRARIMSAKAPSTRSRPMSSNTIKTFQKTQNLSGIYNGTKQVSPKKLYSKTFVYQGINTQQLTKYKRHSAIVTTKAKQQLFQENMKLKKQVNKLTEQLTILKSRMEVKGKRTKQRQKQLDIQFQKPLYWGGSKTHLISGIKHQYQKLKAEYANLYKQHEQLKKDMYESRLPEIKIYAQAVQNQNTRLREKIEKMLNAHSSVPQSTGQINAYLLGEQQERNQKLENKLTDLNTQLSAADEGVKDREKKIMFLQKLIIEKDNKGHYLYRKSIKLQKQKQAKEHQIIQLENQIKQKEKEHHQLIQLAQKENQNKLNQQKSLYENKQFNYQKVILGLQDQNKRLQNLINKLRTNSSGVNMNQSALQSNKDSMGITGIVFQKNSQAHQMLQSIKLNNFASTLSNQAQQNQQNLEKKPKQRQTADKKHSQMGKKTRKVQHTEVQELGQLLQYRLMGQHLQFQKVKDYFDYSSKRFEQKDKDQAQFVLQNSPIKQVQEQQNKQDIQNQETEQQKWNKQYINMQEMQETLKKYPFNLCQQDAEKMARYTIEDSNQQYVYCDPGNQQKRQVVKSIMRSLIGEYKLSSQETIAEYEDFASKFSQNYHSALKTYYPKGVVSIHKFLSVFNSLGLEGSENMKSYMISKLAIKSKNLEELQYQKLFQGADFLQE